MDRLGKIVARIDKDVVMMVHVGVNDVCRWSEDLVKWCAKHC